MYDLLVKLMVIAALARFGITLSKIEECHSREVNEAYVVKGTIHEALSDYIKKHSPLHLFREKPVSADHLPDQFWSQYGMLQKM